jgi:hypothetical protein
LLVARGISPEVPVLEFDRASRTMVTQRARTMNPKRISIWKEGAIDPFEAAGAWKLNGDGSFEVLRDDFFQCVGDRKVDYLANYMGPFFARVAANLREIHPEWILFAELDPLSGIVGPGFPGDTPPNTVNAGHWYDITTLATKTFNSKFRLDRNTTEQAVELARLQESYGRQLGRIASMSERLNGGAPTLIGEFGIPFDLNGAQAYGAFATGDRSDSPWTPHIVALDLMYNALDALLINSTQWNYTASNRNDLAIGDGWNQEDLSIFSRDQQDAPGDINSGGRALKGFVRPYALATQGIPRTIKFDRIEGRFEFVFDADPSIADATVIFVPRLQYPSGCTIDVRGGEAKFDGAHQHATIKVHRAGEVRIVIRRVG